MWDRLGSRVLLRCDNELLEESYCEELFSGEVEKLSGPSVK